MALIQKHHFHGRSTEGMDKYSFQTRITSAVTVNLINLISNLNLPYVPLLICFVLHARASAELFIWNVTSCCLHKQTTNTNHTLLLHVTMTSHYHSKNSNELREEREYRTFPTYGTSTDIHGGGAERAPWTGRSACNGQPQTVLKHEYHYCSK